MGKYRKKPVIIDAEQWFVGEKVEGVDTTEQDNFGIIHTLEGDMQVSHGDWVITGVKGEKYPCKPDIFEQTYESYEAVAEEVLG